MNRNLHFNKNKIFHWAVILFLMSATLIGVFEKLELISIDLRYRMTSFKPRSDIVLVVIDKESLKRFPQWPWPRHYYAEVITSLKQGGAKIIGLDFDFSSESFPSEDQQLVQAVSKAGNVILAAFHEDKIVAGDLQIKSESLPFPALSDAALGIGSILFPVDADGKIRRGQWLDAIQGEPMYSLGVEISRHVFDASGKKITMAKENTIQIGPQTLQLQSDGTFYIQFLQPSEKYTTISFADVLEKRVDPTLFKDKLIIVGGTAIELRDIWAAPFGLTPGVEIQANTLQTLLSGQTFYRLPVWMTLLFILGSVCLLEGSTTASFKQTPLKRLSPFTFLSISAIGISFIYLFSALYAFIQHGFIFDLVPVLLTLLVHYLFLSFTMNLVASRSVQMKTMHLSTLNTVSTLSLKEQPLDRSVTFIFEMIKEFLSVQLMILEIYNPKEHTFIKRLIKSTSENDTPDELTQECQTYVQKAYTSKTFIIVSNLKNILLSDKTPRKKIKSSLFVPLLSHGKEIGVLHLHSLKPNPFDEESVKLLYTVTNQLAMNIENLDLIKEVNQLLNSSIEAFSSALELRDNETEGHSQRVAAYASEVGKLMGLEGHELESLHQGSLLHDIGKIGIPDAILRKPAKLDFNEMETMKNHPEYGYHMLKKAMFPEDIAKILLHHHEQFDGSGYPGGLIGDQIIIYSRIFAVVDTFDAILSNRPYRKGQPYEKAIDEIFRCSGSQFDPKVVDAFIKVPQEQLTEIRYKVDEMVRSKGLSQYFLREK